MTTVGFIGSGHIGGTVARLSVAAGYRVLMSNTRGPQTLMGLVGELGPLARAATSEQAAAEGDLVVLTIPLRAYRSVPAAPLADQLVIDTCNYYPQRDGQMAELDSGLLASSELIQGTWRALTWSRRSTTSSTGTCSHLAAPPVLPTGASCQSRVTTPVRRRG